MGEGGLGRGAHELLCQCSVRTVGVAFVLPGVGCCEPRAVWAAHSCPECLGMNGAPGVDDGRCLVRREG